MFMGRRAKAAGEDTMHEQEAPYWAMLDDIARASDVFQLRARVKTALATLGFHAAYFLAPVVADPRVGRVLTNMGFPSSWERKYRSCFQLIDPLPNIAINTMLAFRWSQAGELGRLSRRQRRYLALMGRFGLGEGIAVACVGPGARFGFAGVGMHDNGGNFSDVTIQKVRTIAQAGFLRYCELVRPFDDDIPTLSQRELDVIRWIGEGKSNAVIAEILDISKSTVDIYVKRIFAKLGVGDRTAASVRALAMGLIVAGRYRLASRQDDERG